MNIIISLLLALIPVLVVVAIIIILVKVVKKHFEYQKETNRLLGEINDKKNESHKTQD